MKRKRAMRMNVSVNRKDNEVIIKLSKDFYDIDSIKMGIKDFSGLCTASVNGDRQFRIVLKSRGKGDISVLGYEFCNYVFALMKSDNIV